MNLTWSNDSLTIEATFVIQCHYHIMPKVCNLLSTDTCYSNYSVKFLHQSFVSYPYTSTPLFILFPVLGTDYSSNFLPIIMHAIVTYIQFTKQFFFSHFGAFRNGRCVDRSVLQVDGYQHTFA